MAKLDLRKKLENRKGKPISKFVYNALRLTVASILAAPMKTKVIYKTPWKELKKGQFVLLYNHTSRCDWMYIMKAMKSVALNFMVSETEFHRAHMHFIFDVLHNIPKKNFQPDFHAIKELKQVVAKGGNVTLSPEGKSSISGTNQPVMIGTGKLLKHLKLPVFYINIHGGYLSNTQWNIANRPGRTEVVFDRLFNPEDLDALTIEEVEKRINEAIYHDDFDWNKTARVKFKGNDTVAVKLEEHLYWCPKCGKELTMKGTKNVFRCTSCGNGATINDYYDLIPLDEQCLIPKNLRVWYELQRRKVYREVCSNPDFRLEENVKIGILPNDHYIDKHFTSEIVGEGKIVLTRDEFAFFGIKNGEPFELHYDVKNMPTVILETDSSYFGGYFNGVYYEFHPERPLTTKWLMSVEECHRLAGGKWQNCLPAQQWIYEDDRETDRENYYL